LTNLILRSQKQIVSSNKKVLILGAGYVSEPVVEYLSRDPTISVTLGNLNIIKK
jgi:alpha-aminoadipic semialdehyde synthase